METKDILTKKIEKMADFQMRKSTHMRFLENCIAENVVPNGLKIKLQVQVGENGRLQKIVDRILLKTSMEITRLVSEEHYQQLQESKPKMIELENELRSKLNNNGEMNRISQEIFNKTELKKNTIVANQNKKIKQLTDKRDCYIIEESAQISTSNRNDEKRKRQISKNQNKNQKREQRTNYEHSNKNAKEEVNDRDNIKPLAQTNNKNAKPKSMPSNVSKNEISPGSMKMKYSEAVTMGKQQYKKIHVPQESNIQHQNGKNTLHLEKTIQELIKCLQNLKRTDDSFESQTRENGRKTRK